MTNTTLTHAKAESLIRLVQNEGKPISEVYNTAFPESPDGVPLGVTVTAAPAVHRMAPVRLTEHQWQQLAAYVAERIPETRRRELIDAKPHMNWAEVARTLIHELETTK